MSGRRTVQTLEPGSTSMGARAGGIRSGDARLEGRRETGSRSRVGAVGTHQHLPGGPTGSPHAHAVGFLYLPQPPDDDSANTGFSRGR